MSTVTLCICDVFSLLHYVHEYRVIDFQKFYFLFPPCRAVATYLCPSVRLSQLYLNMEPIIEQSTLRF